jgi:hypothetical protein
VKSAWLRATDSAGQKLAYSISRRSRDDDRRPSCSPKMRHGGLLLIITQPVTQAGFFVLSVHYFLRCGG